MIQTGWPQTLVKSSLTLSPLEAEEVAILFVLWFCHTDCHLVPPMVWTDMKEWMKSCCMHNAVPGVPVHSTCYHRTPEIKCFISERNLFLTMLEGGRPKVQTLAVPVPLSGSQTVLFSLCAHRAGRELSGAPFIMALILFTRALPSGPNQPSKVLPPNTITKKIRFQHMNLREYKSIQSIELDICVVLLKYFLQLIVLWESKTNWAPAEKDVRLDREMVFRTAQWVKNLPAMQETQETLGWQDPLEKEMATHSSVLASEIPRTEEPGGLPSMESQRDRHNWRAKHTAQKLNAKWPTE